MDKKHEFNTGHSGEGPHYVHKRASIYSQDKSDEYVNIGGARVKNTPEEKLKHVQKTFPNVKSVSEEGNPLFK